MFEEAIQGAEPRPAEDADRTPKQKYAQRLSEGLARAMTADLRGRGLTGIVPVDGAGERTFAGGIGAKRVDVSWAREDTGLLLALSLKTINYRDRRTGNYQKNLTNRRGDLLFESVTLHRRFPFAVLGGFLFFHEGARSDDTDRRSSTFETAHERLRAFSGRSDVEGREERYEKLYVGLYSSESPYEVTFYEAGKPSSTVGRDTICEQLLRQVAIRNPDHYRYDNGVLARV